MPTASAVRASLLEFVPVPTCFVTEWTQQTPEGLEQMVLNVGVSAMGQDQRASFCDFWDTVGYFFTG